MIPANLKNKSFDMADWKPMFALPNILVQEPIEVDGFALVPAADERIRVVQTERPLCVAGTFRLGKRLNRRDQNTKSQSSAAISSLVGRLICCEATTISYSHFLIR